MDTSPKHFFSHVLPHLVLRSFDEFLEEEGVLAFDITGVGQWTLMFGSEEPVKPGIDESFGLHLTFAPKAFEQFVDGTLDISDAVRRRLVTAKGGNFDLLEQFARLLKPPSADLGWDITTTG